jgi:hypothetical protein
MILRPRKEKQWFFCSENPSVRVFLTRAGRKSMHAAAWRWPKGPASERGIPSRRVQPPARHAGDRYSACFGSCVQYVSRSRTHGFRRFGSKQQPRNSARLIKGWTNQKVFAFRFTNFPSIHRVRIKSSTPYFTFKNYRSIYNTFPSQNIFVHGLCLCKSKFRSHIFPVEAITFWLIQTPPCCLNYVL